jgi:hypothetical protein
LKVRYQQRGLESQATDVDDCETPITAEWKETDITRPLFSKIGIFISDADMRKYQDEATQTQTAGTPAAPLMMGLYETIVIKVNALVQKMNSNLLSAQATKFGKNIAYGDANAHTLNFGNIPRMSDGIVKMMLDYQMNEAVGSPLIVGNGAIQAFTTLQSLKTGLDNNGFGAANLKVYNDLGSISKWGANHFGIFAPGLVGLVDFNKNVGTYAGVKGGSIFFTIPVPVQLANGTLSTLTFDAQLKYHDCPVYDTNNTLVADRGWGITLSKPYGLFNAPADMFAATDRLSGFNGALHYIGAVESDTINANIVNTAAAPVNTKEVPAT